MFPILNNLLVKRTIANVFQSNYIGCSSRTFASKTGVNFKNLETQSNRSSEAPPPSSVGLPQTDNDTLSVQPEKDKLYSKLEIELRGIDPAVLKSYAWFTTTAANHLGIEIGKCWAPYKAHHERMTLLKSVFVHKKHRVQYEIRTHFRFMNFHKLTGSTLDTFLEYIERNLPEGVALQAKKTELQKIPDHLKQPPPSET